MIPRDYIDFAKEYPLCSLATLDGDQPRVRTFWFWFADESGFYFGTLTPKKVDKELRENPKIELCFYNNPQNLQDGVMLRINGEVEFLDDQDLKNL